MSSYFVSFFLSLLNKITRCKEIKLLQTTRQQPNYLQIKELSSSWVLKFLQVLNGAQSRSCLHHWWLSWWFADWSSWVRELLILFDGNWVLHRSLFPRKEKNVEWLSHMFRVKIFGVVHSHMLITSSIICISPSWFSVMGTCVIWYSLKSLRITSTNCQTWIRMSICARKTLQIVSRTWICTKSTENSTENIWLLFCTEKITLSNKLRGKVNK